MKPVIFGLVSLRAKFAAFALSVWACIPHTDSHMDDAEHIPKYALYESMRSTVLPHCQHCS